MRVRAGRGFTFDELKQAGITRKVWPTSCLWECDWVQDFACATKLLQSTFSISSFDGGEAPMKIFYCCLPPYAGQTTSAADYSLPTEKPRLHNLWIACCFDHSG